MSYIYRLDAMWSMAQIQLIQPITRLDCGSQTKTCAIGNKQQMPGLMNKNCINHETFLHLELLPVTTVTRNINVFSLDIEWITKDLRNVLFWIGGKCVDVDFSSCISSRYNFYIAITINISNGHSSWCCCFWINHHLEIMTNWPSLMSKGESKPSVKI